MKSFKLPRTRKDKLVAMNEMLKKSELTNKDIAREEKIISKRVLEQHHK